MKIWFVNVCVCVCVCIIYHLLFRAAAPLHLYFRIFNFPALKDGQDAKSEFDEYEWVYKFSSRSDTLPLPLCVRSALLYLKYRTPSPADNTGFRKSAAKCTPANQTMPTYSHTHTHIPTCALIHRIKNAPRRTTTTAMKTAIFILIEIVCRGALVLWPTGSPFCPFCPRISSTLFPDKMNGNIFDVRWGTLTYTRIQKINSWCCMRD